MALYSLILLEIKTNIIFFGKNLLQLIFMRTVQILVYYFKALLISPLNMLI